MKTLHGLQKEFLFEDINNSIQPHTSSYACKTTSVDREIFKQELPFSTSQQTHVLEEDTIDNEHQHVEGVSQENYLLCKIQDVRGDRSVSFKGIEI